MLPLHACGTGGGGDRMGLEEHHSGVDLTCQHMDHNFFGFGQKKRTFLLNFKVEGV